MTRQKDRTRLLSMLGTIVICVSLAACGSDSGEPAAVDTQEPVEKLRIATASFSIGHALTLLAADGGFFEDFGLDVEVVNGQGAQNAVAAAVSGSVQAYAAPPVSVLAANIQTKLLMPVTVYAGLSNSLALSEEAIANSGVAADAPVAERIRALDGLTIASVAAGSSVTQSLNNIISTVEGVEVEYTYMQQNTYVAAMASGAIDGFAGSSPFPQVAEAQGIGQVWLSGPAGEFPGYDESSIGIVMGFTEEFVRENPETAEKVVAAYLATATFIEEEPEKAGDLLFESRFSDLEPEVWGQVWEGESQAFTRPVPDMKNAQVALDEYKNSLQPGQPEANVDMSELLASDLMARASERARGN